MHRYESMEKGYEDIYSDTPYINIDGGEDCKCQYIDMLYIPPHLRGQGHGKRLVEEFIAKIPTGVERVRLTASALGSGDSRPFWESLGFKSAYYGNTDSDWFDVECVMVKGVNGHRTPRAEKLTSENNSDRQMHECREDLDFIAADHDNNFLALNNL